MTKTRRKNRSGADTPLSTSQARAVRATVMQLLGLMRRAHGLQPQAGPRSKRTSLHAAANQEHFDE